MSRTLVVFVVVLTAAPRLTAQTATDLLEQGVRAYQKLEYDAAVALLRESLARRAPTALADSQRARALSYLGATELFQQERDSAAGSFRELVRLDPRYRPDELIFPPQVTNLFEEVRRATKVLTVQVPASMELRPRRESFTARVITTSVLPVLVTLAHDDGTPVRTLWDGRVPDSMVVKWDGTTTDAGALPEDGHYVLRVAPNPATEDGPRPLQVTLDITQEPPDTLSWPPPPTAPPLLPERTSASPALGSLAAGTLAGGAVVALPSLFGLGLLEGQLKPAGGTGGGAGASQLDLVQGTVFAGGRLLPWLEITAGPVVRAYVTDSTTERWVFWQARARVDAPIVVGKLGSYFEVWRALASDVNLPTGAGRIQGGEAGVVYQPPRQRVWLRLSYRMDDALLGGGGPGGNETMEAITLSGGIVVP